jgi:hypothetical protein
MTNYTCGRFQSETDVNASVTAAVLLLLLAAVTAIVMYFVSQGVCNTPSVTFPNTPQEFKLIDDDEEDDDGHGDGLITSESVVNAAPDENV